MSSPKLIRTPDIEDAEHYLNGAVRRFRCAGADHIKVLQFSNSPVKDVFPQAVRTTCWRGEKGKINANHAYRQGRQVLEAVQGSFLMKGDDGQGTAFEIVVRRGEAIYLGELIWHTITAMTDRCIVFGHYSMNYDRTGDYIEDRKEFVRLVEANRALTRPR